MRIGVKYCGGCNPRYDRPALVARLKAELGGGVDWVSAGAAEDAPLDFVLVVCGCTAACARHQNLTGTRGKLMIHAQEQEAAALEQLRHLLK